MRYATPIIYPSSSFFFVFLLFSYPILVLATLTARW